MIRTSSYSYHILRTEMYQYHMLLRSFVSEYYWASLGTTCRPPEARCTSGVDWISGTGEWTIRCNLLTFGGNLHLRHIIVLHGASAKSNFDRLKSPNPAFRYFLDYWTCHRFPKTIMIGFGSLYFLQNFSKYFKSKPHMFWEILFREIPKS